MVRLSTNNGDGEWPLLLLHVKELVETVTLVPYAWRCLMTKLRSVPSWLGGNLVIGAALLVLRAGGVVAPLSPGALFPAAMQV